MSEAERRRLQEVIDRWRGHADEMKTAADSDGSVTAWSRSAAFKTCADELEAALAVLPAKHLCECGTTMVCPDIGCDANKIPAFPGSVPQEIAPPAELGLNVDITDVDRLRNWATSIETYGPNMTQWSAPSFIIKSLRDLAERLDKEIRAVGELRKSHAEHRPDAATLKKIAQDFNEVRTIEPI